MPTTSRLMQLLSAAAVAFSVVAASCGVDSDQLEGTAVEDSNGSESSGNAEQQLAGGTSKEYDPIQLGERFDWCWELQRTWEEHVLAQARFAEADERFGNATDELDVAEASAARENALYDLEVAERDAMGVLREAVDASQGQMVDGPKAIAYARAWQAYASSSAAAATFEKTEAAVRDLLGDLPVHLTDTSALDTEAVNASERALPTAIAAIDFAMAQTQDSDHFEETKETIRAYHLGLVSVVSSLQYHYNNHDEARADYSRAAEKAWEDIFLSPSPVPKISLGFLTTFQSLLPPEPFSSESDVGVYRNIGLINVRTLGILVESKGELLVANARSSIGWGSRERGELEDTLVSTIDHLGMLGTRSFPGIEVYAQDIRDHANDLNWKFIYSLPFYVAVGIWRNSGVAAYDYRFDVENTVFSSLLRNGGRAYDAFRESFQESCR